MADDQPFVELLEVDTHPGTTSRALLWAQLKPHGLAQWCLMSAIIACVLMNKVVILLTPLTWRYAVDSLSGSNPEVHTAMRWVLAYSALAVVADALAQLRGALWGRLSNDITKQVSVQLFAHLHALSLRWHLNRKTGEVLRVIDIGVKAVTSLMSVIGFSMGPTVLELILVSGIFLRIGVPAISLCVMMSAGFYVVYTVIVTRMRTQHRRAANDASKAMQDKAVDSLLNFETVKLFAAESTEARGYDEAASAYARAQVRSQDSLSVLNWGQTVCMQLGLAGGLVIACLRAADREMSVGEFVMIQMYIMQIFRPLIALGSNYNSMMQSLADLEKMTELLAIQPEVKERDNAGDLREMLARIPREQRNVEFDNVTFFYQPGKPGGVKNLSFEIRSGSSVALVGPSGSGKSTSTRLLCRLMEVAGGAVLVGGTDVRDVTQHSLRSCVSVVSQDTVLFNSTIRANLAYGKPGASDAELAHAAGLAQVLGFLGRMEGGYDARVGERGLRLSGGEKQRLGIARALLTDPAVLVLDEATSALDASTEREVQEALGKAAEGRCTLVIAHRLSTVVDAGEIVVLRAGEVVERGTHRELLQVGGLFAQMWAAQADVAPESPQQCKAAIEYACCKCCPRSCPLPLAEK